MSRELEKAINVLEQIRDTLEWQVGSGVATIDFIFPKVKYALTLLGAHEADEESTSAEELRNYSFDFAFGKGEDDD
jgi:hypothetical protein